MRPAIGVCDYGVGNLRSVERALLAAGAEVRISADADVIRGCDGVVLPGVGAFGPAAAALRQSGLGAAVRTAADAGRPVLGVCLGHQLLFESSEESAFERGLGLLRGRVERLRPEHEKVPHIGWNSLHLQRQSPLLTGIGSGEFMYFVHSYVAAADARDVVAVTDHGGDFAAAVQHGNVMGTQFHPEKSGAAGLRVYANLVALSAARILATSPGVS